MSDRYAADWLKSISDCRHRGERIGTLWLSRSGVTGDATLTVNFLDMSPLERADVLADIIGGLPTEYDAARLSIGRGQNG